MQFIVLFQFRRFRIQIIFPCYVRVGEMKMSVVHWADSAAALCLCDTNELTDSVTERV